MESRKSGDEPIGRAGTEMQIQRRDMWTGWEGRGLVNQEIDINTLPCVKYLVGICHIAREYSLVLYDDLDGWDAGSREVKEG